MALGDVITDEIQSLIAAVYHRHSRKGEKWTAKEIQDEVAKRIQAESEKYGRHPADWPGLRAVQEHLTEIHRQDAERLRQGIDVRWRMGSSVSPPLPSEAVPWILLIQDLVEKNSHDIYGALRKPVTIRQAQWIARLYGMVRGFHDMKRQEKVKAAAYLYSWSMAYATNEIVCELSSTPFDTTELDQELQKGGYPIVGGQWLLFNEKPGTFFVDAVTARRLESFE